jgi:hypothetical protein
MKQLILTIVISFFIAEISHAQWTTNSPVTSTTNTIGIGTSTNLLGVLNVAKSSTYNTENTAGFVLTTGTNAQPEMLFGTDNTNMVAYIQSLSRLTNYGTVPLSLQPNGGNVGIGTINPVAALSVVNSAPVIQLFDKEVNPSDGSSEGRIAFGSAGAAEYASIEVLRVGNALDDVTAMRFKTSNAVGVGGDGNNIERMRISPNGNVSIGTADSKGYRFAVNGSAIATSMTIKPNSAWPDYVFKKNYQLRSLAELKDYIDQNQHLPEIPSEHEILKNGINVGEMSNLHMKKIEELTLYLIEKDKKEKEHSETIQILETRLKTQQEQIDKLKEQVNKLLEKIKN